MPTNYCKEMVRVAWAFIYYLCVVGVRGGSYELYFVGTAGRGRNADFCGYTGD